MKILRIDYIDYPPFSGHSVIFEDGQLPIISFLVGNNGSGKTKVLDSIFSLAGNPFAENPTILEYHFTLRFNQAEMQQLKLQTDTMIYKVIKGQTNRYEFVDLNNTPHQSVNQVAGILKIVYSTIEVNFNHAIITSVTAKDIDSEATPKEKSVNLSIEIPQLLVDIKNLDDAEQGAYYKSIRGTVVGGTIPENIGTRLERFINAFHRIYDGSKSFVDVRNEGGEKKIVFKDANNHEVSLKDMSTGEKQIIYRVGHILKNVGNIDGAVILIDEPEISLHPTWQLKLKDFLLSVFVGTDVQFIIATHSPFIFENLNEPNEVCIKVNRANAESRKIALSFPGLPAYRVSVGIISYLAYGVFDVGLHIELYTLLQIRQNLPHITGQNGIETWLRDPQGGNMPERQNFWSGQTNYSESIMTWIRNKIHHGDNPDRPSFTKADLKDSIDTMIQLLR